MNRNPFIYPTKDISGDASRSLNAEIFPRSHFPSRRYAPRTSIGSPVALKLFPGRRSALSEVGFGGAQPPRICREFCPIRPDRATPEHRTPIPRRERHLIDSAGQLKAIECGFSATFGPELSAQSNASLSMLSRYLMETQGPFRPRMRRKGSRLRSDDDTMVNPSCATNVGSIVFLSYHNVSARSVGRVSRYCHCNFAQD